jgi:hypothetical protein
MVAYQTLDSSNDAKFLYSKQSAKCQSCNFKLINCFMCLFVEYVQWK